jgi:hypothetical protein
VFSLLCEEIIESGPDGDLERAKSCVAGIDDVWDWAFSVDWGEPLLNDDFGFGSPMAIDYLLLRFREKGRTTDWTVDYDHSFNLGTLPETGSRAATIIRDICGSPFQPVTFHPSWLTDTVVTLARVMKGSRDFSAMPILADALQEAGCDNADVLEHCRGPAPHVRGCWVVDSVLGKEQD